jgi:hypothetical protein
MVRVADLEFPRGKDAALHEFILRINEVMAATETAIERVSARVSVRVVRFRWGSMQ